MLQKWGEAKKCKWKSCKQTTQSICYLLQNPQNLPTPLSIRDFTATTAEITNYETLHSKMSEKSIETSRCFANEICQMNIEKYIFLLFPLIDAFPVEFVEQRFECALKLIEPKFEGSFQRTFAWFKDDKIDVRDGKIVFSHPSYFEALEYSLNDEKHNTFFRRNVLSKLLISLLESPEAASSVAYLIRKQYGIIPKDSLAELIDKLQKYPQATLHIVYALVENYNDLSDEIKQLMPDMAMHSETRLRMAFALLENIKHNSVEFERLLIGMAKNPLAANDLSYALYVRFQQVSPETKQFLLKILGKKRESHSTMMRIINDYAYELSDDILDLLFSELIKYPEYCEDISWRLMGYFDRLTPEIRESILQYLIDKRNIRSLSSSKKRFLGKATRVDDQKYNHM